jgi:DNA-binding transcriptional LysR family regulator
MIETAWLRAFAAFAEDTNLSRTAHRMHLTQPAIHGQIRRLSEALGVPLYRRAGRGLALTPEGVEVAAFARDLADRTNDLVARMRGEVRQDRVVLAAGAGALLYLLGDALRAFGRRRAARLEVLTLDADAAVDAVRSGLAHVGVAALEAPPEHLHALPLTSVEQVLIVPRGHPLAKRRRASLASLADEPMVVPPKGRPHRVMIEAALSARGIPLVVGATARGWELTIHLVGLGLGVAIVNACCHVPRSLVRVPLAELPRVNYMAFRRAPERPGAATLLQDMLEHAERWRDM